MKIIKPFICIPQDEVNRNKLIKLEVAARRAYKSEDAFISGSNEFKVVKGCLKSGHESVLEHEKISMLITCDRGVTHELVRHRIAAYTMESTRYCNYSNEKFGNEITVIDPYFLKENVAAYANWVTACETSEQMYFNLLELGISPQWARDVLPNSLKTEIVVTFNMREWRHFIKLRAAKDAHPQMQQVAISIYSALSYFYPELFLDLESKVNHDFNPDNLAKVYMTDIMYADRNLLIL